MYGFIVADACVLALPGKHVGAAGRVRGRVERRLCAAHRSAGRWSACPRLWFAMEREPGRRAAGGGRNPRRNLTHFFWLGPIFLEQEAGSRRPVPDAGPRPGATPRTAPGPCVTSTRDAYDAKLRRGSAWGRRREHGCTQRAAAPRPLCRLAACGHQRARLCACWPSCHARQRASCAFSFRCRPRGRNSRPPDVVSGRSGGFVRRERRQGLCDTHGAYLHTPLVLGARRSTDRPLVFPPLRSSSCPTTPRWTICVLYAPQLYKQAFFRPLSAVRRRRYCASSARPAAAQ